MSTPRIKKLDEDVVNRIAAGEVIQRPSSALKEMLENSLDAQSTSITVTIKQGGMKLLQIQDNGCGIHPEDLPITCERFTTSKLKTFDDLQKIQTFGFRGEALASISHVAHVTITSMTPSAPCAYRAHFCASKLVTETGTAGGTVRPCAGVQGTTITVTELFYNMPTRRKALTNPNEEYCRIADVVARYAVDNPGVAMCCKKAGESRSEVQSRGGDSTSLDVIQQCFGRPVAQSLQPFSLSHDAIGLQVQGHLSNANHISKRGTFIFFINKRLVESQTLRKAIEQVYSAVLPKGNHPFVYLSISLPGPAVDVNVHPTKREVKFLHEEEIVEKMQEAVSKALCSANESREFKTQQAILFFAPPVATSTNYELTHNDNSDNNNTNTNTNMTDGDVADDLAALATKAGSGPSSNTTTSSSLDDANGPTLDTASHFPHTPTVGGFASDGLGTPSPRKRALDYKLVRTHTSDGHGTLDAFLTVRKPQPQQQQQQQQQQQVFSSSSPHDQCCDHDDASSQHGPAKVQRTAPEEDTPQIGISLLSRPLTKLTYHTPILTSVFNIVADLDKAVDAQLTEAIRKHVFVGLATASHLLVQSDTKLLLLNIVELSRSMLYHQVFLQFSHLPITRLKPPIDIRQMIELALEEGGDTESSDMVNDSEEERIQRIEAMMRLLLGKASMLAEYFSVCITESGMLESVPQVIERIPPHTHKIPAFLLSLCTEVEWKRERQCFEGIANHIAELYTLDPHRYHVPKHKLANNNKSSNFNNNSGSNSITDQPWLSHLLPESHLAHYAKHFVCPAMRSVFNVPRRHATDGSVVQVACLEQLYRVFERC